MATRSSSQSQAKQPTEIAKPPTPAKAISGFGGLSLAASGTSTSNIFSLSNATAKPPVVTGVATDEKLARGPIKPNDTSSSSTTVTTDASKLSMTGNSSTTQTATPDSAPFKPTPFPGFVGFPGNTTAQRQLVTPSASPAPVSPSTLTTQSIFSMTPGAAKPFTASMTPAPALPDASKQFPQAAPPPKPQTFFPLGSSTTTPPPAGFGPPAGIKLPDGFVPFSSNKPPAGFVPIVANQPQPRFAPATSSPLASKPVPPFGMLPNKAGAQAGLGLGIPTGGPQVGEY